MPYRLAQFGLKIVGNVVDETFQMIAILIIMYAAPRSAYLFKIEYLIDFYSVLKILFAQCLHYGSETAIEYRCLYYNAFSLLINFLDLHFPWK